jgi:diguanylate cyclase
MDSLFTRLSESLQHAKSQEELVRPLLEMLEQVTQLESTYLTTIDFERDLQHVLYAHNTKQMQIPEGLTVPWNDTLCQRALSEGRMFTANVQECWGDSQAAQVLGIRTYVSAPIQLSDGTVYGTLCAASAHAATLAPHVEGVLQLFAKLISQHVERERLMEQLQERNNQLTQLALTDPLTQLPNRAALLEELQRLLARALRTDTQVLVAYVDLDGFKQVNDVHGHATGDQLLQTLAQRLQAEMRASDMVARMGGDEFVMVAPGPSQTTEVQEAVSTVKTRLRSASQCTLPLADGSTLHYPGASVGVVTVDGHTSVDSALLQADAAMYADKAQRRI